MAMGNGDGQPSDWRESQELLEMQRTLASALTSVERLLMDRGMPPEQRLLLSRTERRRIVRVYETERGAPT